MTFTERRKYPRIDLNWQVNMVSLSTNSTTYDILILNISSGGISFKCNEELKEGAATFLVRFPFDTLQIYIIWRKGNRYGALFSNPLMNESVLKKYL